MSFTSPCWGQTLRDISRSYHRFSWRCQGFSVHSWFYIKHLLGILLLRKLDLPVTPDCLVSLYFFNNEATISEVGVFIGMKKDTFIACVSERAGFKLILQKKWENKYECSGTSYTQESKIDVIIV